MTAENRLTIEDFSQNSHHDPCQMFERLGVKELQSKTGFCCLHTTKSGESVSMGQKLVIHKLNFNDLDNGLKKSKGPKPPKPRIPTTIIREFKESFPWCVSNWMALTETNAKEIKSPTYCIFAKGRENYDDTAHR